MTSVSIEYMTGSLLFTACRRTLQEVEEEEEEEEEEEGMMVNRGRGKKNNREREREREWRRRRNIRHHLPPSCVQLVIVGKLKLVETDPNH